MHRAIVSAAYTLFSDPLVAHDAAAQEFSGVELWMHVAAAPLRRRAAKH